MDTIDLTTRAEAGAALTQAQHDSNLTAIQTAVNAVIAKLDLIAEDDGKLLAGALKDAAQITDNLLTLAKLKALDAADYGKWLRANATTGAIEAAQLFSASASDNTAVAAAGVQSGLELSEITIPDVPAGDVLVWLQLMGKRNAGSNGGTVTLLHGATELDQVPTHGLDGAGTSWMPFVLQGRISGFAGGSLVLAVQFETSEDTSDATFGVDGDGRFGRRVRVLAGL